MAAKTATSIGYGGGVSSVDPAATRVGLRVLKMGGNAVDAAVATAAALGVTEPYSAGIGGGGYFVLYNAEKGKVQTIDGRETAPAGIKPDAFIDPATGKPYNFTPELVTKLEPDVVEHHEQHVRRAGGRGGGIRPPRRRLPVVPTDLAAERAPLHVREASEKDRRRWTPSASRTGAARRPDRGGRHPSVTRRRSPSASSSVGEPRGEELEAPRDEQHPRRRRGSRPTRT